MRGHHVPGSGQGQAGTNKTGRLAQEVFRNLSEGRGRRHGWNSPQATYKRCDYQLSYQGSPKEWQMSYMCICAHSLSCVPLFVTLRDCSPPGFSVHGILQARILAGGCHTFLQGIFLTQGLNSCLFCLLH